MTRRIVRILGIDASDLSAEGLQNLKNVFAEAYEITAFIADDPETLDMLTQFGKDYAAAQPSIGTLLLAGVRIALLHDRRRATGPKPPNKKPNSLDKARSAKPGVTTAPT